MATSTAEKKEKSVVQRKSNLQQTEPSEPEEVNNTPRENNNQGKSKEQSTAKVSSKTAQQIDNKKKEKQTSNNENHSSDPSSKKNKLRTTSEVLDYLAKEVDAINLRVANLVGENNVKSIALNLDDTMSFIQKIDYLNNVLDNVEQKLSVLESELEQLKTVQQKRVTAVERTNSVEASLANIPQVKAKASLALNKAENGDLRLNNSSQTNQALEQELVGEKAAEKVVGPDIAASYFAREIKKLFFYRHKQEIKSLEPQQYIETGKRNGHIFYAGLSEDFKAISVRVVKDGKTCFEAEVPCGSNSEGMAKVTLNEMNRDFMERYTDSSQMFFEDPKHQSKEESKKEPDQVKTQLEMA